MSVEDEESYVSVCAAMQGLQSKLNKVWGPRFINSAKYKTFDNLLKVHNCSNWKCAASEPPCGSNKKDYPSQHKRLVCVTVKGL